MIVGASYDIQGSSLAQLHLHQILDASGVNAVVMPGSEFLLGRVQHAFDENGDLKDQGTIDFLESCSFRFIHFAILLISSTNLKTYDLNPVLIMSLLSVTMVIYRCL